MIMQTAARTRKRAGVAGATLLGVHVVRLLLGSLPAVLEDRSRVAGRKSRPGLQPATRAYDRGFGRCSGHAPSDAVQLAPHRQHERGQAARTRSMAPGGIQICGNAQKLRRRSPKHIPLHPLIAPARATTVQWIESWFDKSRVSLLVQQAANRVVFDSVDSPRHAQDIMNGKEAFASCTNISDFMVQGYLADITAEELSCGLCQAQTFRIAWAPDT